MQRPVVALALVARRWAAVRGRARYFHEAIVEREIVTDGVLPAVRCLLVVERIAILDEFVDFCGGRESGEGEKEWNVLRRTIEGHLSIFGTFDRQRYQRDIRV